jgi:hypothetical protein
VKIITDFKTAEPTNKFDADATELIEAYKGDNTFAGAIEVSVLAAKDDADALNIIARETRGFQAATLKAGYSARSRKVTSNGDGTVDVIFTLTVKKERKVRTVAAPVEETAPVEEAAPVEEVEAEHAGRKRK